MSVTVPSALRHAVIDELGGEAWIAGLDQLVERATQRWGLQVGEPFPSGMAAWTAPATSMAHGDVVVKISFPHEESRHEAAALAAWRQSGAVELIDDDPTDQALLLSRVRPGTSLRDAQLELEEHLEVGAQILSGFATARIPAGDPFQDLVSIADGLASIAEDGIDRTLHSAPYRVDLDLVRHTVALLRTLPPSASQRGLNHGDLNPGNVLGHDNHGDDRTVKWVAIDPKPVWGDLAWDPWPLITQWGPWLTSTPQPAELARRAAVVSQTIGLDPARVASWAAVRSTLSALAASERGWWTGYRGADGDFDRATTWNRAAAMLGG